MQEYRLSPQYVSRLWIRQAAVIGLVLAPIPLYLAWKGTIGKYLPLLALFGFLAIVIAVRSRKPTRDLLSTLRIHLDHQAIGRTGANLPELFLRFDEVTRITEIAGQGIVVVDRDPARNLGIPAHLEGYAEVRARLALLRDIEQIRGWQRIWRRLLRPVQGVALVAVCYGAFATDNVFIVAFCSLILSAIVVWSTVQLGRNSDSAPGLSKLRWIVLLPLFGLIGRLVIALMAIAAGRSHL